MIPMKRILGFNLLLVSDGVFWGAGIQEQSIGFFFMVS